MKINIKSIVNCKGKSTKDSLSLFLARLNKEQITHCIRDVVLLYEEIDSPFKLKSKQALIYYSSENYI